MTRGCAPTSRAISFPGSRVSQRLRTHNSGFGFRRKGLVANDFLNPPNAKWTAPYLRMPQVSLGLARRRVGCLAVCLNSSSAQIPTPQDVFDTAPHQVEDCVENQTAAMLFEPPASASGVARQRQQRLDDRPLRLGLSGLRRSPHQADVPRCAIWSRLPSKNIEIC